MEHAKRALFFNTSGPSRGVLRGVLWDSGLAVSRGGFCAPNLFCGLLIGDTRVLLRQAAIKEFFFIESAKIVVGVLGPSSMS